jgi:antitoxin component HigA of HigAB toxin-antitoxin module
VKTENISPELKSLLDRTPVLTESDISELAEANRKLTRDPEFIAGIIKSVFVNDILTAMEEQGLNKNQLAKKWGKSRQYLNNVLDREKSRNFTIDTIVSLSMTLGLVPQRIELRKMELDA